MIYFVEDWFLQKKSKITKNTEKLNHIQSNIKKDQSYLFEKKREKRQSFYESKKKKRLRIISCCHFNKALENNI